MLRLFHTPIAYAIATPLILILYVCLFSFSPCLAADGNKTLSEIAAGLSIDETLEIEKEETTVQQQKTPRPKHHAPLVRNRIIPTAVPAPHQHSPYLNPYNSDPRPVYTPPKTATPSPLDTTQEPGVLEPASGTTIPEPAPVKPVATTPSPSAFIGPQLEATPHDKESSMRQTIEEIEKSTHAKPEGNAEPLPPVQPTDPVQPVTKIGSVPSMEKPTDYVSLLEKSLLTDPIPLPKKLPFFDKDDHEVILKNFKGKLVLLNFWATWCTPCAEEMPSLDALQEDFNDRELPIKVVPLSQDFKGVEAVQAFYKQHNIQFLDAYIDKQNSFFRELGVISLPTTLIIDQEGNEILRISGYIDWNKPEVKNFIRSFLKE